MWHSFRDEICVAIDSWDQEQCVHFLGRLIIVLHSGVHCDVYYVYLKNFFNSKLENWVENNTHIETRWNIIIFLLYFFQTNLYKKNYWKVVWLILIIIIIVRVTMEVLWINNAGAGMVFTYYVFFFCHL